MGISLLLDLGDLRFLERYIGGQILAADNEPQNLPLQRLAVISHAGVLFHSSINGMSGNVPTVAGWPPAPNEDHRWMEASPEWHNAFSQADMRSGGKLRVMSLLLKAWGFAGSPPSGISSLYVDMLLATSPIMTDGQSYGQCLDDCLKELVGRELRALPDPAGLSGDIAASPSYRSVERLYAAAITASAQAQAALEAQARGETVAAKRQWRALFKRRI